MTWCIQILLPGQKNRGSVTYQQAQPFPETPGPLVHSFFLAESVLVGLSLSSAWWSKHRSAALLPWNDLSELNSKDAPAWSFFACLLTDLKVIVRIVLHHCCNNTWQNYEGHLFPRFLCLPVFPIFSVVFCHRLCSSAAFRLHCFSFKCTIHVSRASEKRLPGSASHCLPNSVQIRQTISQRQGNHLILLSPLSSPQT